MRHLVLLLCLAIASVAHGQIVGNSMGGDLVVSAAPDGARLRTMGGNIRVKSAGAKVIARTMGGNIDLENIAGSVSAGTMGGEVEVELVGSGKRSIEITSLGGSVELTVPPDFSGDFDVELERDEEDDDQTIVSDFPLQVTQSQKRHWFKKVTVFNAKGKSGAGANRVRISVIGGDVKIRRR